MWKWNYSTKRANQEKQRKDAERERNEREEEARKVDQITASIESATNALISAARTLSNQIIASVNAIPEQAATAEEARRNNESAKNRREWIALIVAIITVTLLFAYTAITYVMERTAQTALVMQHNDTMNALEQAQFASIDQHVDTLIALNRAREQSAATQGQLKEMEVARQTTIAQLRAYLGMLDPLTIAEDKTGKAVKDSGGEIDRWSVTPQIKNSGATAARDATLIFEWQFHAISEFADRSNVRTNLCSAPKRPPTSKEGMIVNQGDGRSIESKYLPLQAVREMESGKISVILVVEVSYRDIFPDTPTHHLYECFGLVPINAALGKFGTPIYREFAD